MSQIPRFALWWCSSHCLFLCTCLCYMKRKTNKYSKRQSKSWRGPLSRVDFLPPGKSIGNGQRRRENEERVPPSKETKVNTTFTSNLEKIIMKFVLVVLVLLQKLYMVLFCPLQIYPDKKAKLLKKWPWCWSIIDQAPFHWHWDPILTCINQGGGCREWLK